MITSTSRCPICRELLDPTHKCVMSSCTQPTTQLNLPTHETEAEQLIDEMSSIVRRPGWRCNGGDLERVEEIRRRLGKLLEDGDDGLR